MFSDYAHSLAILSSKPLERDDGIIIKSIEVL